MRKESLRIIIGQNIRRERKSCGISRLELAELTGLSPGFIDSLEQGKRGASSMTLLQLSLIFDISIDQLFYLGNVSVSPCNDQTDTDEVETRIQVKCKKLSCLVYDFDEKKMDCMLEFVEFIRLLKRKIQELT